VRVLWFGDFAPTGFGTVTRNLGRRLVERGLDLRFISQNDQVVEIPDWLMPRAVNLLSLSMDTPPGRLFDGTAEVSMLDGSSYRGWVPDAAVILGDFAASRIIAGAFLDAFASVRSYHYVPIEGIDLPPLWAEMWRAITPIAMSEFGAREIAKVTGSRPPVILHGVDPEEFRPPDPERPLVLTSTEGSDLVLREPRDAKAAWMGYFQIRRAPATWVLRTDANWPRKRYPSLFRSMVPVLRDNPTALLVVHAKAYGPGGYLPDSLSKYPDLEPVELVGFDNASPVVYRFSGRESPSIALTNAAGLSQATLLSLYWAADLYTSNSAEGFGLTIAEALACGIPAVGLKYSAVPEVIGDAGVVVPAPTLIDNEYDHYWAGANERQFGQEVERLLRNPVQRRMLGDRGPDRVRRLFDWDHKAEQFLGVLVQEPVWQPSSPPPMSEPTSGLPLRRVSTPTP
jgi:glycosyltransferase involved in cell wall biosynthesis